MILILFNNFENSFLCASTHKSDLRELVPEIYYFPELFININDFDFGNVINDSNDCENSFSLMLMILILGMLLMILKKLLEFKMFYYLNGVIIINLNLFVI